MTRRTTWLAWLAAVAMLFAACGDDDDGASADGDDAPTDVADADGAADDDGGDGDDEAATGEFGTITINGDVYTVSTLNRCIPFSESDDDLDLQALGEGVKINIYATSGVVDDVSVDGSTVTSEYGSPAFGGLLAEGQPIDGERTAGSATLEDATGSGTTVDVEWDVEIPDEVRDCSL